MGKAESYVESYLKKQCKKNNILCYKFTSPGVTGVPDRIVLYNNKIIFVETKSKTGIPSARQKVVIKQMRNAGAIVYIPHTREEIDDIITYILS